MKKPASLLTSVTFGLGLTLVACGEAGNADTDTDTDTDTDEAEIDATPEIDAGSPDAAGGGRVSDLSDAEWTALCMEVLTEEIQLGQEAAFTCTEEDCMVSPTAVEDCIANLVIVPDDCAPPDPGEPIRDCDAPVADLETCFGVFLGQFEPYGGATCANVAELPPLNFDPAVYPECDALLEQCPNVFNGA